MSSAWIPFSFFIFPTSYFLFDILVLTIFLYIQDSIRTNFET